MARYEEEIECRYCNSSFSIQYNDSETDGNIKFCPFCSESLPDDYFEEDEEY